MINVDEFLQVDVGIKMKHGIAGFNRSILAMAIACAIASNSYASPEGGEVVGGAGDINHNGSTTTINQATDRMAINWQSFDVAADERVQFIQPSSSSIALNNI